jgi:hypothetical protein
VTDGRLPAAREKYRDTPCSGQARTAGGSVGESPKGFRPSLTIFGTQLKALVVPFAKFAEPMN